MSKMYWKSRRLLGLLVALFVLFFSVRLQYFEHQAVVELPKMHPNEVWEFVADFSNMKYLNPTILDFNIVDESGNYDHWRYTVEYSEFLSHWPHLYNQAVAHFNIKRNMKTEAYYIYSKHKTCLFHGIFCLNTESEFKFTKGIKGRGTVGEEKVKYQCPMILAHFCQREVLFQRNAIMANLEKKFN